jgi:putative Mn2+ efflux pump MntP
MLGAIDPFNLLLLSLGLAMDAFSVSTVIGFSIGPDENLLTLKIASIFGVFHIFMPVTGWFLGFSIVDIVSGYDHWIAFCLLLFVGLRMIIDAKNNSETLEIDRILGLRNMILFSVAVSLDSMAVGLSFFLENLNILAPSFVIGFITFIISAIGFKIGSKTSEKLGKNTQIIGGIILILIGFRILLSHLI